MVKIITNQLNPLQLSYVRGPHQAAMAHIKLYMLLCSLGLMSQEKNNQKIPI